MCSAERQVEETMRRAFWDVLDEKLRAEPPDYSHALVLVDEIRQVRACPASPTSAPRLVSRRTVYSYTSTFPHIIRAHKLLVLVAFDIGFVRVCLRRVFSQ